MQISVSELHEIEGAAFAAGVDAAMDEVCSQIPGMLDEAVKHALEAKAKRPTKPTYPSRRKHARNVN